MSNSGQNEGIHVLVDFVCEAINSSAQPRKTLDSEGRNAGLRVIAESDEDVDSGTKNSAPANDEDSRSQG
jgi:hypothetical protein